MLFIKLWMCLVIIDLFISSLLKTLCPWMDSLETFQTKKSGIESPVHTVYHLFDVNLRRWVMLSLIS